MARALFPICLRSAFALTFFLFAASLAAQDLRVSPQNKDLAERLRAEALVLSSDETATPGDIIATAKGDYARLLAVLYEEGYFGASVSITLGGREASGLTPFGISETGVVAIAVDLGQRFTFGRASVLPLPPGAELPEGFAIGETAGTAVIQAAARSAVSDWRAASHAKAEVSGQSITARHSASELDVALAIDPGPALRFGQLILPPENTIRGKRIRQIAGLPEGQPFNPDDLRRVRNRLVSTGTFNSVVLREAEVPNADGTLDIALGLEAAPPRRLGFGAEIESTNGLSLEAFWLHRNIFNGAERLRFDAGIEGIGGTSGGIDYTLGVTLSIPGFRRADDTLSLFATLERRDEESFKEDLFEFGVRGERQLTDGLVIGNEIGLRFSESTDSFGTRTFEHLILSIDGELDRRDDPLNPSSGIFTFVDIKPFIGISESETGVRLEGDLRGYRALGDNTVIAGRAQIGSVFLTSIEDTPPDFLFFSGGGGTVRGQGFQSLAIDGAGGTTGGRSFAGLSLELRQGISDSIGLVGFFDVGYIGESSDLQGGGDHAGAGLGLRYITPLGPLRVDVGVPVGGSSDGSNYGLYIGLGQAF